MNKNSMFGIALCEIADEVKENDLERIVSAGLNGVRFHISWRDVEKERGKFDFSFYDDLINNAKEKKLFIIAGIGSGYSSMLPDWILEENKKDLNLFTYIPQLSRFINESVERFKGKIDIWQAENEINHTSFHVLNDWRQKSWILNPVGELSILLGIISSIKANDPHGKIMINLECDNPNWLPLLKFFTKKKLPFDIIGIDFYPCYSPILSPFDPIFSDCSRILKLRDIIDCASKFKKDVIIAETGYPAQKENYTYENQASYIHQIVQIVLTTEAKGLFVWELADQFSKGPEFPEYYFGLLDNERGEKLAWNVYKNEIKKEAQTIFVSVKGLILREPKPGICIYINDKLVGYTNIDGFFLSQLLPEGEYSVKIKGFFPWQRRSKKIKLEKGESQFVTFFI